MRHRNKVKKLGLRKDHRTALLRNLTTSLILHDKIRTTEARAKVVSARFGRLMNIVQKKEAREAIRMTPKYLSNTDASRKLLEVLKPKYADRQSGFTRITRIGLRDGDKATLVQIELI
ncbi:50S ribosomal protein L17 [Candidatus Peregrinibacteria bacterium CG11_big_fil_rev_8_21_14_0_20_46_8]|nr:MAG: 50S ribosomal protein L17 [Candidatus Peregrinibacteria bacterium CG11_big_fil_rev_8_21_14_0_20_46_8]